MGNAFVTESSLDKSGQAVTATEEFSMKIKERANFSNSLAHSNFYKILIE